MFDRLLAAFLRDDPAPEPPPVPPPPPVALTPAEERRRIDARLKAVEARLATLAALAGLDEIRGREQGGRP